MDSARTERPTSRRAHARAGCAVVAMLFLASCGGEDDTPDDVVPTSAPVLTTAPSEFTTTTTTIPPGPVLYEIQPGDNLSAIAEQFEITLEELLQANPTITDPGLISVGQTVLIPAKLPEPSEDGLQLPDPEAPDLPALTSSTTTTEPLATTAPPNP